MSDDAPASWGSFQSPVVGSAGVLIRQLIKSLGYVAGVSGWQLEQDGDAELNDVTVRGAVVIPGSNGSEIRAQTSAGQPQISFAPAATVVGQTIQPGLIIASSAPGIPQTSMAINGPEFLSNGESPSISLASLTTVSKTSITLDAGRIDIQSEHTTIRLSAADQVLIGTANGMVDTADGVQYRRAQSGSAVGAIGAAAVNVNVAVTYPFAFPVGITPIVVTNLLTGSAASVGWISRALSPNNTGFTMNFNGPAPGAATSFTAQWMAFAP
jgi:hypothetical protein